MKSKTENLRRPASQWGPANAAPLIGAIVLAALAGPSLAATITVQTFTDGFDPNCQAQDCTLRDAVRIANQTPGHDFILLPQGTFALTLAGADEDLGATGDLDLADPDGLTIEGIGPQPSVLDAALLGDRIFDIHSGELNLLNIELRNGSALSGDGGAIRYLSTEGMTLSNCRLIDNQADDRGGAIYSDAFVGLTNCLLSGNVANPDNLGDQGLGGGVYLGSANFGLLATSTRFEENRALGTTDGKGVPLGGNGGALNVQGSFDDSFGTPITIDTCLFEGNHADARGGAVFIGARSAPSFASMVLLKSTFVSNTAQLMGGGIAHGHLESTGTGASSLLFLESNLFRENVAGENGGGIAFGFSEPTHFAAILQNTTFAANRAGLHGGGIFSQVLPGAVNDVRINQCTLQANRAGVSNPGGFGGGIYIDRNAPSQPPLEIANTIVAKNLLDETLGGSSSDVHAVGPDDFSSGGRNLIGNSDGGQWTPADGDILGTSGALEDPGTTDELESLGNGPDLYRLLPASQAIDAGTTVANGVYPFGLPLDQRGRARPVPSGGRYDIGAYEFDPIDIATPTPTETATYTPSHTPTETPTFTATLTASDSPTPTSTGESTETPTPTATPTFSASETPSPTSTSVSCDLVQGPPPAPNPRCDGYDLLALLADRRGLSDFNTDFNSDGAEDGLDWFVFALEWYSTPE